MARIVRDVPSVALAVYAHPDDPDVSAGGTLAAWARAGCEVHVCICADGEKGTLDPATDPVDLARRRRAEVAAAGEQLGVAYHHWMGWSDGEIEDHAANRARLVRLIRDVRPESVLSGDPTAVFFGPSYINHRDHRTVGWLALDAVAPAAGSPLYFPEAGPAHKVRSLFLSATPAADAWVDITDTIDAKAAAIACHASQVGEPGEWLRGMVHQRAEEAGQEAGVRFAEAFRLVTFP